MYIYQRRILMTGITCIAFWFVNIGDKLHLKSYNDIISETYFKKKLPRYGHEPCTNAYRAYYIETRTKWRAFSNTLSWIELFYINSIYIEVFGHGSNHQ